MTHHHPKLGLPWRYMLHELRGARRYLCDDPDNGAVPCADLAVYIAGYLRCLALEESRP